MALTLAHDIPAERAADASRSALRVPAVMAATYFDHLRRLAWLDRAVRVSPRLVEQYGPERAAALVERLATAPGDAVALLTACATAAGTWQRVGADIRALIERDRDDLHPLGEAGVTSAAPTGRPAAHAYVTGRGDRTADGAVPRWHHGVVTGDLLPAVPAGEYVPALPTRDVVAHGADAIIIGHVTRALFGRYGLPSLLGGEHLSYAQVIHAGRSDDPYGVANRHARVADAIAAVAPDLRDVVAEACATFGEPERSSSLRWPDATASPRYAARQSERAVIVRTATDDGVPETTRAVGLPTWRVDRDGTVLVAIGHRPWRVRPGTARSARRRRVVAAEVSRAALSREAADRCAALEPGTSLALRTPDGVRVRVSRGKASRYAVTITAGDAVTRHGGLRRPTAVLRAVEAALAA